MGRIPDSAASGIISRKKIPQFTIHDFRSYPPCWRLGHFDIESRWGMNSLLGDFTFIVSNDLEEYALENDDDLVRAIDSMSGNRFVTLEYFWNRFSQIYGKDIPSDVVKEVSICIKRLFFLEKLLPKLRDLENSTWEIIDRATHDNGRSSNHNDSVANLSKEAQDRLSELNFSDRSEIYSLRLENKIRIFGFREMNYLDIIWVDTNHEVYPVKKKHT